MVTSSPPTSAPGTDKTGMDFRRILPEIRCQPCLSPGSEPTPRGGFSPRFPRLRAGRALSGPHQLVGLTPIIDSGYEDCARRVAVEEHAPLSDTQPEVIRPALYFSFFTSPCRVEASRSKAAVTRACTS